MKLDLVSATCMGAVLMTAVFAARSSLAAEPTGASLAWTSEDQTVVAARQLVREGKLSEAEALLRKAPDSVAGAEMLEIISRYRSEYGLSGAQLAAKLQRSLPGATIADLERWRTTGEVQWRLIDGTPWYFRGEPSNIFRFCGEAKQRRVPQHNEEAGWTLVGHLKAVIAAADARSAPEVIPIKHRVTYRLTVPAAAPGMKPGALVRAWLPFPQEYRRQQTDVKLLSATPAGPQIAPVGRGEHSVEQGAAQRTAYFEQRVSEANRDLVFEEVFEFMSSAYYPKLDDALARPLPSDWAGGNLDERPPHVVFTPELRKAVAEAVGAETNPLARARRIFHWVDKHIAYNAEEEYCLIPSLSAKALSTRRGDCGVQGTLFITMCRCAGIPARWQSGWETKPVGWNMHDWAEFYVEPWGWLPADPSYGVQKSDDPRVRDFYLGHQDSYRLIVNRDYGCPLQPEKKSLRSEPADFQRGEVEIDGWNLYLRDWDYDVKFEWEAAK